MEDRNHNSIRNFFYFIGIGFLILCIKVKVKELQPIETIKVLFFTFGYISVISIWFGLFGMVTVDVYAEVKKKLENCLEYEFY